MQITNLIRRFLARVSTFGPVSAIPRDAKPLADAEDTVVPDMGAQGGKDEAGDAAPTGDGDAEGSASEDDAQGGSGDEEPDEPQAGDEDPDADPSTEPSSGEDATAGATEAGIGVDPNIVAAVRAAVDVLVSQPDATVPSKMKFGFEPDITAEDFAQYEKDVEAGKGPQALARLLGKAVSEALGSYDEKRVLPMEVTLDTAKRDAVNDRRISAWAQANPGLRENDKLWSKMQEVYSRYAQTKGGRHAADRISMEQLAILAAAEAGIPLAPAKPNGKGAKPASKPDPAAAKRAAVGATKTPGAIATLSRGGQRPAKDKGYDGPSYRDYLKANKRDPF